MILTASGPGCASRQLSFSTVLTANTHQTILFQMVLDNVAMFVSQPDTMPWHIRVRDGTVQVQDQVGIGQHGGGLTTFTATGSASRPTAPQGARKVALQWGTDAVGDPVQLFALQTAYRRAARPAADAHAELHRGGPARPRRAGERMPTSSGRRPQAQRQRPETSHVLTSMVIAERRRDSEGWFCVGRKKDVPRDACYVGHHGDTYVWVMPEGVDGLTRFTLLVLSIVKLTAGAGRRRRRERPHVHAFGMSDPPVQCSPSFFSTSRKAPHPAYGHPLPVGEG